MPLNPESFIFAIPSKRWGWIPAWWVHTIEFSEIESLSYAAEPLRGTKMVDPRWQKTVVLYGVKGGFRCN